MIKEQRERGDSINKSKKKNQYYIYQYRYNSHNNNKNYLKNNHGSLGCLQQISHQLNQKSSTKNDIFDRLDKNDDIFDRLNTLNQ